MRSTPCSSLKTSLIMAIATAFLLGPGGAGGQPPASEPVLLQCRWPVGKRLVFSDKQTVHQVVRSTLLPDPMEQDSSQEQKYSFSILEETAEGGREIQLDFLGIRMEMKSAQQNIVFDSDQPNAEADAHPLVSAMRLIPGSSLSLSISAKGEVENVRGYQEMADRFLNEAGGNPGILAGLFEPENFKQMFANTFSQGLPDKPVEPGDQWNSTASFTLGGMKVSLATESTFTTWVEREGRKFAQIDFTGDLSADAAPDREPGAGVQMSIKEGSLKGRRLFDPKKGLVVAATTVSEATMHTIIQVGGGDHETTSEVTTKQTILLVAEEDLPPEAAAEMPSEEPAPEAAAETTP